MIFRFELDFSFILQVKKLIKYSKNPLRFFLLNSKYLVNISPFIAIGLSCLSPSLLRFYLHATPILYLGTYGGEAHLILNGRILSLV
ncbi:MAG: hypothetical protein ACJAYO_000681 [Thalassolituus oleivorans]|jgi:hypothetical protein